MGLKSNISDQPVRRRSGRQLEGLYRMSFPDVLVHHGGTVDKVTPGLRVSSYHIQQYMKFKSEQVKLETSEFIEVNDHMTHYFVTGLESWNGARTNRIIEAIAGVIYQYYQTAGLLPFVAKLKEVLGKTLVYGEKVRVSDGLDKELLERLWVQETHTPMPPTEYSSGIWMKAAKMLEELLMRVENKRLPVRTHRLAFYSRGILSIKDLPGEIRNTIYRNLVTPDRCLHELKGHMSDFYASQMLLLNHKIKEEASAVWSTIPLTIHIGEADMALYEPSIHTLSSKLLCKRLTVDFSLNDGGKLIQTGLNVVDLRIGPLPLDGECLLEMIHRLGLQISHLPELQEFAISTSRLLVPSSRQSPAQIRLIFPDQYFECFKVVKGLRNFDLNGDLDQSVVRRLRHIMTGPKDEVVTAFNEAALFNVLRPHQCLCMRLVAIGVPAPWLHQT